MANAVVGETTPNYFKEILEFLYSKFGDLEYYSLEAIYSKVPEDKQREFNIFLVDELKKQADFIKEKAIFKDNKFSHNVYQLTIEGFTYCRIHKDYFSLE